MYSSHFNTWSLNTVTVAWLWLIYIYIYIYIYILYIYIRYKDSRNADMRQWKSRNVTEVGRTYQGYAWKLSLGPLVARPPHQVSADMFSSWTSAWKKHNTGTILYRTKNGKVLINWGKVIRRRRTAWKKCNGVDVSGYELVLITVPLIVLSVGTGCQPWQSECHLQTDSTLRSSW